MSDSETSNSSHSSLPLEDSHDDASHHSSISGDSQLNDHRHQNMSLPIRTESNLMARGESSTTINPSNITSNPNLYTTGHPAMESLNEVRSIKSKIDPNVDSMDLRSKMCIDDDNDEYAVNFNDRYKSSSQGINYADSTTLPIPIGRRQSQSIRRSRSKSFSGQVKHLIRPREDSQPKNGILMGHGYPGTGSELNDDSDNLNILIKTASRTSSRRRSTGGDGDSDLDSHASRESQETEEDVCFPMLPEHIRVQGIDFDELDDFIEEQREENELIAKREEELKYMGNVTTSSQKFSSAALRYTPKLNSEGSSDSHSQKSASDVTEKRAESASSNFGSGDGEPGVTFDPQGNKFEDLVPTRFSFFSSEREETIHKPDLTTLVGANESIKSLFGPEDSIWWLDCTCPTDSEMKVIAKAFGIHPLTAEDIRMQETREKVELFKSYYFVCFHTFETDPESEDFLEPINVYIVVFRTGMLTFHFSPIVNPANVRRRVRQLRDYVNVSADWLCYAMIDDITDGFAPIIHSIEYEADAIEDSVFTLRDNDFGPMLLKIGDSRRKVMTLMRLLQGKADVIKMFSKRCQEDATAGQQNHPAQPRADIALYLGDIQDHIITMFQSLLSYEKIFSRSHTNYLAQLQVESFYINNKVTDILSKVTVLGTIMVPMNLITGLFGMNVKIPGEGHENYGWFGGIIGLIFLLIIVSVWAVHIYMNKLNASEGVLPQMSVRDLKFGRKNRSRDNDDRRRQEMISLPTKFTKYGEW